MPLQGYRTPSSPVPLVRSWIALGKILTIRLVRPRDVRESIPEVLDGAIMRALARLRTGSI